MTATCTLCGTLIAAEPDGLMDAQRDDRTFGRLGGAFRKHMSQHHANEPQRALDQNIMQGNIGQMAGAVGITAQALVLFSYLESSDESFRQKTAAMRDIILKAIEQKQAQPVVTPF